MKKFYTEPEIELVNITLIADVLGPSTYDPTEESVPVVGTEFVDPFE
ncbi:MAG: hypothetical protein IJD68_01370 [Ruminococcus sp.]|nr:hypothetical protein [Ruminococcus sp.]